MLEMFLQDFTTVRLQEVSSAGYYQQHRCAWQGSLPPNLLLLRLHGWFQNQNRSARGYPCFPEPWYSTYISPKEVPAKVVIVYLIL